MKIKTKKMFGLMLMTVGCCLIIAIAIIVLAICFALEKIGIQWIFYSIAAEIIMYIICLVVGLRLKNVLENDE